MSEQQEKPFNEYYGVDGYFGTTKSLSLGFIIASARVTPESTEAMLEDGFGDVIGYGIKPKLYTAEISGKMVKGTTHDAARAAASLGALATLPALHNLQWPGGCKVVSGNDQNFSNTDHATFSMTVKIFPAIPSPDDSNTAQA